MVHRNERIRMTNEQIKGYTKEVDKNELKAFKGILYIAGVLRLSSTNTEGMWSAIFGKSPFFCYDVKAKIQHFWKITFTLTTTMIETKY